MAAASRAWMFAIPVATTIRPPAASSTPACAKASLLPPLSGIHVAPKPSRSYAAIAAWASAARFAWSPKLQTPTRPSIERRRSCRSVMAGQRGGR
jgi:hypothetical protein